MKPMTTERAIAPYGAWESPVTTEMLTAGALRFEGVTVDGDDVYWVESRPDEAGRCAAMRLTADGAVSEVTTPAHNARTRVHEYGGGALAVSNGVAYFSNFADQRLYRRPVDGSGAPAAITPEIAVRYADATVDDRRGRLICVAEDHRVGGREAENLLAAVPTGGGEPVAVHRGFDFYASPRLSPDGRRLAWVCWNHPNMPWDATELWVADVAAGGALSSPRRIAGGVPSSPRRIAGGTGGAGELRPWGVGGDGGPVDTEGDGGARGIGNAGGIGGGDGTADAGGNGHGSGNGGAGGGDDTAGAGGEVSVIQPAWGPDGTLYCVSDVSGWWNLHRWDGERLVPVLPMEAELGLPPWLFGMGRYAVLDAGRIAAHYGNADGTRLGVIDAAAGRLREIATPFTTFGSFAAASRGRLLCVAASAEAGSALVAIDADSGEVETLRRGSEPGLDPSCVSRAEPISCPSAGRRTAHAYYYPPRNPAFHAPGGERPPLLTFIHGGPTGAADPGFKLGIQYWTTRGFAVVDVDYGGSTGYGTAYRRLLRGGWGIVDREDCEAAARYLVARGDVDPARLAIRGGSAGGYTTLCALAFGNVFTAGASYYGVSDAAALASDTHKFESRYLDALIGPWPERADLYEQRSPIHAVDRLSCPVIFLQGLEDAVVPPDQTERMADALRRKGLPVACLMFEGEQHGFRRAANIRRAAEAELYFYGRIFGFRPAGEIEPVEIENLDP